MACQSFAECTARVKLELTDFNIQNENLHIFKKKEIEKEIDCNSISAQIRCL